jgi:hypothetical protein
MQPPGSSRRQANEASGQSDREVAQLGSMSLAELRAEWQRRYGDPPRHRAADLLRRILAWRMLEKDHTEVKVSATPGMRLAREWAGKRHEVCVIESGVVYEGCTYGSLSEVARHITGQRWNGPRFFGLRQENVR